MALESKKFGDQQLLDESFEKTREKRISQKESEARGRKAVIVLFLITVILSLFFWMKTEIPSFFKQLTQPYKEVIEKGGE
jgi:hypothetical protein